MSPTRSSITVLFSTLLVTALLFGTASAKGNAPACGPALSVVASPDVAEGGGLPGALTAISSTDVWAVGAYSPIADSSGTEPLTEHWNGTGWTIVPSPEGPPDTFLNGLSGVSGLSSNDVWAVGNVGSDEGSQTWTVHWDGSAWAQVPTPDTGGDFSSLYGVAAVSPDDVWAVGASDAITGPLIEHWSGTEWSIVSTEGITSVPGLNGVSAVSATDIWAVGSGDTVHWDGSTWTAIPRPNVGEPSFLDGVAALSHTDVWTVGQSFDGAGGSHTLIEHWDGGAWSVVPSPDAPGGQGALFSVAAVAAGDLWAVGNDNAGGPEHALVEHWDGLAWSVPQGPIQFHDSLSGVAVSDTGEVWGGGLVTPQDAFRFQPLFEHICPIQVLDSGFSPSRVRGIPTGATVAWSIPSTDADSHSITDKKGRLFDSGVRPPGSSFTFTFNEPGNYRVFDVVSSHRGSVKVQ